MLVLSLLNPLVDLLLDLLHRLHIEDEVPTYVSICFEGFVGFYSIGIRHTSSLDHDCGQGRTVGLGRFVHVPLPKLMDLKNKVVPLITFILHLMKR